MIEFEDNMELRPIKDYEFYYVSEDGRVFSDKYKTRRELSQRKNSRGYMYVNLCKGGKYKSITVHRLVAIAFLEKRGDEGLEVNHIDGNKENNCVSNLEWITKSQNMKHAFKNGLNIPRIHESHHSAKLKEADVSDIRDRFSKGEKVTSIHKSYLNVSISTIRNVCNRKCWR